MKLLASTFICLTLSLSGSLSAQDPSAGDDDRETIRALIESLATHIEAGDLSALDTMFSDGRGVHIIEGAGVNHGWVDYRDNHLEPELEIIGAYRFYAVEPVVRGNVAWTAFRYDLTLDLPAGEMEREGRGTAVLEKADGRWLISHLHTSGRAKPVG